MDTYTHDKQAVNLAIGQAFNQGFLMGYGEGSDLDIVGDELDFDRAFGNIEAFDQAALSFLTDNRGAARTRIIEEHFLDETEAAAFDILSEHLGTILHAKNQKLRAASIAFVFDVSDDELTFDLCCQALDLRPWVIRTRMMYEFYRNATIFESFPKWNVPMGEALNNEILYLADEQGELLAKIVWGMPSIPASSAIEQAVEKYQHRGFVASDFEGVLATLLQTGHISQQAVRHVNHLYLTGRNPFLARYGFMKAQPKRRARGFYWSDLWVNDFF